MPMTDSNSLFSDSYKLANLKTGYKIHLNEKLSCNVFYGLDNIFDEKYASQILINAYWFWRKCPKILLSR